jgi:predicted RNA-binding protein with PUA-like domain
MARSPSPWLVKSDPDTYGFDDLAREGKTAWTGVKNPTAQLHLRSMARGDRVVVYHSGAKLAVGLATVSRGAFPDPSGGGKAVAVELRAGKRLAHPVSLAALGRLAVFRRSPLLLQSRLSVMPLSAAQERALVALSRKKPAQ